MKKAFLVSIFFFSFVVCGHAGERIYHGKVIDADTREPIEGAVVVAYWVEKMATPAGATSRLKEVKEELTDKNGEWSIVGEEQEKNPDYEKSWRTKTYFTYHPIFIIFKPGYCSFPKGFSIEACKGKMKPRGAADIAGGKDVELPKIVNLEDRIRVKPAPIGEKENWPKQRNFIHLIREEWRFLYSKDPGDLYKIQENPK